MKKILLIANFLFSVTVFAQPGTIDLSFNTSDLGFGNGDGPRSISSFSRVVDTAVQIDEKIIIGGSFTTYNGSARNNIARVNANGSLDTSFNPGIGTGGGTITSISLQSDGKIIIGGWFTSYNGTPRNGIARINSDGSLDTSFNPGTGTGTIHSISLQSDGKIIIGGSFTTYNGTARNNIARVNANGSLDVSFNPGTGADGAIFTTSIQSDGKIIIGGQFISFNNIQKKFIARLNPSGSLDSVFNSGSGTNGVIRTTSIQSDGGIIIGGDFTTFNGRDIDFVARFNVNGTLDSTFGISNNIYGNTYSTCIQNDGKIIVGSSNTSNNGTINNYLYRILSSGQIDSAFNPSRIAPSVGRVESISMQSDGKIIIGAYGNDNKLTNKYLVRLNLDATIDTNFNKTSGANFPIKTTSIQSDGKIIIGGDFNNFNGINRNSIARLNINGSIENTINPSFWENGDVLKTMIQNDGKILVGSLQYRLARLNNDLSLEGTFGTSGVRALSIQNDGSIILGGNFISQAFFPRSGYGRVFSNGSFDRDFNSGFNPTDGSSWINCVTSQPDGKTIISGGFSSIYQTNARYIARLNPNAGLDASFSANNLNNEVLFHIVQSDGKIIIGGLFTSHNGISRNRIARLNNNGSLDTTFNPGSGANGGVRTISIQSDGKIIIGGDFTTYNGTSSNYIARLNTDGTLDTSFNIGTGANGIIRTTSIQSDGKIIIGGDFTSYNGTGRNRIARINGGSTLSNPTIDISRIVIYPNPSNGYFTLQIEDLITPKTIEIYDIIGRKIYFKSIVENKSTLDLSNQPKGIYFYKISDNNSEIKSGKLVIE